MPRRRRRRTSSTRLEVVEVQPWQRPVTFVSNGGQSRSGVTCQRHFARRAGREGEVVGLERFQGREAGGAGQHLARPHAAGLALRPQHLLQEVGVARVFLFAAVWAIGP